MDDKSLLDEANEILNRCLSTFKNCERIAEVLDKYTEELDGPMELSDSLQLAQAEIKDHLTKCDFKTKALKEFFD